MDNFSKLYLIELKCIDEGNSFGLKLGEIVYACDNGWADYTYDIDFANTTYDLNCVKKIAKRIYDEGNFMPRIFEVIRTTGKEIKY